MVTLLYIPFKYPILQDDLEYIRRAGLSILPATLRAIEKDFDMYHIYNDNKKIGVLVGYGIGDIWYGHRILLYEGKERYFKRVLDTLKKYLVSSGYRDIIINPNDRTKAMYDKHKVGKEL